MIFVLMLLYCLAFSTASELECPKHLVVSEPACNRTCRSLGDTSYDECSTSSGRGCTCPHYVNSQNECVEFCDPEEVPCKTTNNTFLCNYPCERSCSTMYGPMCFQLCTFECACSLGFVKNENGDCILPQDCDVSEIVCPSTAVLHACGNGVMETCYDRAGVNKIQSTCIPTCSCPGNMVYDEDRGGCIDPKMCYGSKETQSCIASFGYFSTYICNEDGCGCGCYKGFFINEETQSCEYLYT